MKTAVIVATVVALGSAAFVPASAGDREWATAGKVLTGVAVAGVFVDAFRPREMAPVVYSSCAPAPVYCAPAPRVVYVPAPVVCGRPVYYGSYGYSYGYGHGPHGSSMHGHEGGRRW